MAASPTVRSLRREQPSFTYAEERDSNFIDELLRISEDKRTEALGPNYFAWMREFFLFRPSTWAPALEFQIKLRMPELLTLILQESFELTEPEPKFYVDRRGARQEKREDALSTNWTATKTKAELFKAHLWAMMGHTGFCQVQFNPIPPRSVRLIARNPENVYPDPFATDWRDWEYVLVRVPMAPDEILRVFPGSASRIPGLLAEQDRHTYAASRVGGVIGSGPESIELPPGAMETVVIGRPPGTADFLSVDYLFIKDDQREDVAREVAGSKAAGAVLPPPSTQMKYPTGRMIVRVSKLKLWDGPCQYRRFPVIPIFSMPPLYGVWGTPPLQLFIQMQHLAESMMSQSAENAIRMNYGYRALQDGALLNPDALDKIGGVLRFKTGDDVAKSFRIVQAQQFTPQQGSLPDEIIARMERLFGYTPERQGKIGAGNISPGLLEAGIAQAQAITRMRAGLLADSIEDIGRLEFETMVDYLDDTVFTDSLNGDFRTAPWEGVPLDQIGGWNVRLDAASIRPISSTALKQMALPLINLGLPLDIALKWLQVPDADSIGQRIQQEKQMQMLAVAMGQAQQQKGKGAKK